MAGDGNVDLDEFLKFYIQKLSSVSNCNPSSLDDSAASINEQRTALILQLERDSIFGLVSPQAAQDWSLEQVAAAAVQPLSHGRRSSGILRVTEKWSQQRALLRRMRKGVHQPASRALRALQPLS